MTESRADGAAARPRMGRAGGLVDTPADPLAMVRSFAERGWGDGLPIVPATEGRVTAERSYSDRDPLEVLGVMSPRQGEVTRHALAVNAVMAGCEPSYFPVVVAAIEAILDPRFNIASLNATTHPVAMLVLVNGAIGRELRVHGGSGCFGHSRQHFEGPSSHRRWRLGRRHIDGGGQYPGRCCCGCCC